ncbi:Ca(2+)-dependent cysteine protease [Coemansia sp. RSA 2618]|nr:Ca(2+)-dependent cysteine protease [Coemansia sp. RSA 2618]
MSFASGPSERYQAPPPGNERYAYNGSAYPSTGGYQGDVAAHSRPPALNSAQQPYYENSYAADPAYGQRPPLSAPVQAPPYNEGHQASHVTGQYAATPAYGAQPGMQQPQHVPPPHPHQYAYSTPPSANEPYAPPPAHQHPPPIAPSASAPVVAQYNHDPYAPPPPIPPPQARADTYYQPPPPQHQPPMSQGQHLPPMSQGQHQHPLSQNQHRPPISQGQHLPPMSQNQHQQLPPQQHQSPPPRNQQPYQQGQGYQQPPQAGQYYSQAEPGYYRHDALHSPSPPGQQYQPPPPAQYNAGQGYVHSDTSQSGSFYGNQGPPPPAQPPSGPMRQPPLQRHSSQPPLYHSQSPPPPMALSGPVHQPPMLAHHMPPPAHHQSPPLQHQQLPPARHSSLRQPPMRHSPVYPQRNSPQPQPLSQSQAQLQRHSSLGGHPGLVGSQPAMGHKGGLAAQPPYRNSPTPISSAATAPPIADAGYNGSAQVPGGLRRGPSLYDQQRDMHMQQQHQPPAHMASLVGSMGALSLARSSPQPQGAVFSQPTLVGSSTMPAPYRGQGMAPQGVALQNARMAAQNAAMAAQNASMVSQNTGLAGPNKAAVPADITGSTLSLAQTENSACPMWTNIDANGFSAYQHQISVQQSNLSGTKYALIIGINYYELEYSQTSNINSAHAFKSLLMRKYGYLERNIVLLSDDQEGSRSQPTHHNITTHVKRMMREVQPNDAVFFYYCGFGRLPMQLRERRSEVLSGIRRLRCDYILPSDFEMAGAIDAEYLHRYLVRQLPQSARLTALFNSIVHETGLGVPYKYAHSNGVPVLTNAIAGSNLFEAGMKLQAPNASLNDLSQRLESSLIQQQQQHQGADADVLARIQRSSGDIIVFGWDRDYGNPEYKKCLSQTPSNQLGNYWAAAMENALRSRGASTFGDVLAYLQAHTRDLTMLPFIACGRKISMDEQFII